MDSNLTRERPAIAVERLAARARLAVRPNALTLIAVASALLTLAVRLPFLDWPLTVDEAGYAYGARWWAAGVSLYSDEMWFDRPQGIFVVYRIGMALLGDSTEAIRLNGALWGAASTVLVVMIANRLFDRRIALITGLLYAVLSGATYIEGFIANAEVFMITAATASAYLVWGRRWFAAGLLAGVAIVLKPSGAAAVLLGVWWLIHHRESFRGWLMLGAGVAIPLVVALVHGIAMAGVHDYLYATVLFRLHQGGNSSPFISFIAGNLLTAPLWAPLIVMAGLGLRHIPREQSVRLFLLAWLATSFVGMAMGGNWWTHYYQQFIPPLTLIATAGLAGAISAQGVASGRLIGVGLAVTAIALSVYILPPVTKTPEEGLESVLGVNIYSSNADAAEYVRSRTDANDRIYVAAFGPDIIYLADRRTALPQLYPQQLISFPGAADRALELVENQSPAYVLILRWQFTSEEGWIERLDERVASGYWLERSFGDIEVWRRR